MPDTKENNTESTPNSYELLIEKINGMEKKLEEYKKKIDDVTAMNRALLGGNIDPSAKSPIDKEAEKKALEEKLIKGLKR